MTTAPDMPDNYPWLPGSNRFPLADLGELSARLGSIVTYDRRGEVVWADQFDLGFAPWRTSGNGTGNAVVLAADDTERGGYAAQLQAGTSGLMTASLVRHFDVVANPRYGYEIGFLPLTAFGHLDLNLFFYGAAAQLNALVKIHSTDDQIYINHGLGVDAAIAAWHDYSAAHTHYTFVKVVGDWETGKYVRLLVNEQEYDISAYSLVSAAGSYPNYFGINAVLYGQASPQAQAQIGHVVVTANEP